jgi:hypothetical protein
MLQAGQYQAQTPAGEGDVSLLQNHPEWLWGPPNLLFNDYWDPVLRIKQLRKEVNCSPPASIEVKNK